MIIDFKRKKKLRDGETAQFAAFTCSLTTISNSGSRDLTPFSYFRGHQACMWYTCIHTGKILICIKLNFKNVYWFYLICMSICLHGCMCHKCMLCPQTGVLDHLWLQSQTALSCCAGAGNTIWVFCKDSQCSPQLCFRSSPNRQTPFAKLGFTIPNRCI